LAVHRDIVLRWISQISALIARLLRRDPSLSLDLVHHYLEDAEAQLLGPASNLIERLDPPSAAALLDDPHRLFGYAHVLALRSALHRAEGRPDDARACARRSVAFAREACRRIDPVPTEWTAWITAAEAEVGAEAPPGPPEGGAGSPAPG
jgi:hypothetical protein